MSIRNEIDTASVLVGTGNSPQKKMVGELKVVTHMYEALGLTDPLAESEYAQTVQMAEAIRQKLAPVLPDLKQAYMGDVLQWRSDSHKDKAWATPVRELSRPERSALMQTLGRVYGRNDEIFAKKLYRPKPTRNAMEYLTQLNYSKDVYVVNDKVQKLSWFKGKTIKEIQKLKRVNLRSAVFLYVIFSKPDNAREMSK